jgi:hypothetical protein
VAITRRGGALDAVVLNGWAMLARGLLLLTVSALAEGPPPREHRVSRHAWSGAGLRREARARRGDLPRPVHFEPRSARLRPPGLETHRRRAFRARLSRAGGSGHETSRRGLEAWHAPFARRLFDAEH